MKTDSITVLYLSPLPCVHVVVCTPEALVTSRGYYEWPQTYPSETAELKCTMGGTVTRYCSLAGRWEKPDVSNCLVSAAALFKYLMQVCVFPLLTIYTVALVNSDSD